VVCVDSIFYKKKTNLVFHGYMGSPSGNSYALYHYMQLNNSLPCELWWTGIVSESSTIEVSSRRETPERNARLVEHISYLLFLMRFKIIVVASVGDLSFYLQFLSRRGRLKVCLGHGFCLKSAGILSPSLNSNQKKVWSRVGNSFDVFSVTSQLEKYLVSSTVNCPVENCLVVGPQRSMGSINPSKVARVKARLLIQDNYDLKIETDQKIVFYCPTHRDHKADLDRPMLFGFSSLDQLNDTLKSANTFLFVREHGIGEVNSSELTTNIIYTNRMPSLDFHFLAPAIDGLITDYSGIFLEYLSSHIRLAFWQYDIAEYRKERGFSISEDIFLTGSKIVDKEDLKEFIFLESIPREISAYRNFWQKLLYENTTSQALELTVKEVVERAKRKRL
jgi:CDP-glycerol glycerophosphotransferase (TagB/SpsB family)